MGWDKLEAIFIANATFAKKSYKGKIIFGVYPYRQTSKWVVPGTQVDGMGVVVINGRIRTVCLWTFMRHFGPLCITRIRSTTTTMITTMTATTIAFNLLTARLS